MCYTHWTFYKTLTSEEKKFFLILKEGFNTRQADIKKTLPGIILSCYYHKNRKFFLKHAKYLGIELVVSSRIHNISLLKYVYKYVIENDVKDYNLVKEESYIPDFTSRRKIHLG